MLTRAEVAEVERRAAEAAALYARAAAVAARLVRREARDDADAALLLEALGLHELHGPGGRS